MSAGAAGMKLVITMGIRQLPVVDADRRWIGLVDEVAIAHELVRARMAEQAELAASGPPAAAARERA